jgi:acyl-CoA synthetase (AMP-forming)/AMP-acid ligase II
LSPNEIEEAAIASGATSQALAMGIEDDRLGQAILLVAVATNGNSEAQLRSYFTKELPAFMMPSRIIWRDSLPLSPNGKIDRAALEREFG